MATPTDRLDDLYLGERARAREQELLDLERRLGGPVPTLAEPGAAPRPTPAAETPAPAGALPPIPGRTGRLLQEGGEAVIRGAERLVEASPVGVAQRALAGEPPRSPLTEAAQAGVGALEVVGGMGAGAGALVGQGAVEAALVGAGLPEARARKAAEVIVDLGLPVAAAKIPLLAKTLAGGSLSKRVIREIIGTPDAPRRPGVPETPPVRVPAGGPATPAPPPLPPATDYVKEFRDLAATWEARVETQRRGTRTHAQARAEGRQIEMTVDDVRTLRPGTVMTDDQAARLAEVMDRLGADTIEAARRAVASGDPDDKAEAFRRFYTLALADPSRKGVVAEMGRGLSIMNDPLSGINQSLDALGQTLRENQHIDDDQLLHLIAASRKSSEIARAATIAAKPTTLDVVREAFINNLLWNPVSWVKNFAGNSFNTMYAIPERFLAEQFGRGRAGHVRDGEAAAMTFALLNGWTDAWRLFRTALKTGEGSGMFEAHEAAGLLRTPAIRGETYNRTGSIGRAIDMAGTALRVPGRVMLATDELFKALNYRMELWAQIHRTVMESGLTGQAAANLTHQLLANPPAAAAKAAHEFALVQTLQRTLDAGDLLDSAGRALLNFRNDYRPGVFVVPFVKTPTNGLRYASERTPILNLFMETWRKDFAAGGHRRDAALAKITLGSGVALGAYNLWAQGIITGGGPQDPALRATWLLTHEPYSVKVGSKWYGYGAAAEGPMAILGLVANLAEIADNLPEAEASHVFTAIAAAATKFMMNKSSFQGTAEVLGFLADPERRSTDVALNVIRGFVPFSGLLGNVARSGLPGGDVLVEFGGLSEADRLASFLTGERERKMVQDAAQPWGEVRTWVNDLRARVPGGAPDLPAKRNLFYETQPFGSAWGPDNLSPIYTAERTPDAVDEELWTQRVRLRMPDHSLPTGIEGAKPIGLTPTEYDTLVKLAAGIGLTKDSGEPVPRLKARLAEIIASPEYQRLSDGPDGGKAMRLLREIQGYRDLARAQLLRETADLKRVWDERLREAREKAQPAVRVGP